ncbi:MAG TPA: CsbD family protein [Burkholderiaceae bacterium]
MNRCQMKGALLTVLGTMQLRAGDLIGNPRLANRGHLRLIEGRSALAVGEAQQLIKRCLAQRGAASRMMQQAR